MIPKILQLHWLWNDWPPFGDQVVEAWRNMLPDWELKLVRGIPEDFPEDLRPFLDNEKIPPSLKGDLLRIFAMWKWGGIYVDFDSLPIRPFDEWLLDRECFIPRCNGRDVDVETEGVRSWIDTCIVGSVPQHPFWLHALENCRRPAFWHDQYMWFCGFNTFDGHEEYGVDVLPNLCQELCEGETPVDFIRGRVTLPVAGRGYLKHYRASWFLAALFGWQRHQRAVTWKDVFGIEPPEHI